MFLQKRKRFPNFHKLEQAVAGRQRAKSMKSRFNLDTWHTTYLFWVFLLIYYILAFKKWSPPVDNFCGSLQKIFQGRQQNLLYKGTGCHQNLGIWWATSYLLQKQPLICSKNVTCLKRPQIWKNNSVYSHVFYFLISAVHNYEYEPVKKSLSLLKY
jgi:hypothetical protein